MTLETASSGHFFAYSNRFKQRASKMRVILNCLVFVLLPAMSCVAVEAPPAVSTRKGPLEITLRLSSTKVKRRESLWYRLELKNVGNKPIALDEKVFRDPWAMYQNIRDKYGIYLEVIGPPGKYQDVIVPRKGSPPLRPEPGHVQYSYEAKGDEIKPIPPEDVKELEAKKAEWRRRGLSEMEQAKASEEWWQRWNQKMRQREDMNPENWVRLEPGASTRTLVWNYRGDPQAHLSSDGAGTTQRVIPGFTELWAYYLYYPGKYKIRAVYNHQSSSAHSADPLEIRFETNWVSFEVLP